MSGQVDLDALRALEAAATAGPWEAPAGDSFVMAENGLCVIVDARAEDAPLIAAARNALVPLLDEIESLRARVAAVEALARDWQWYVPAAAFRAALEAKP